MKTPTKAKKVKGLDYDHATIYPNEKELSSSQVLRYWEDPQRFYFEYVLGVRDPESQAMYVGKIFSAAYTDRKFNWKKYLLAWNNGKGIRPYRLYEAFEKGLAAFPVIPKRDCEVALRCEYRGWKFRATLDGYFERRVDIENKTGQMEWTQQRFDESDQVTFQYWVKWKKDGKLFDYCQCNWLDFRSVASKLVHSWNTHRTLDQLEKFEREVIDYVIDGIEAEAWQ